MDKKKIIIVFIVFIIIIVILLLSKKHKKNNNNNDNIGYNSVSDSVEYLYTNSLYQIVDPKTNEVLRSTNDIESFNRLKEFYDKNPDYRATPPVSPNAQNDIIY